SDDRGILIRDLWPDGISESLQLENPNTDIAEWQVVPFTYEETCDWAHVVADVNASDRTHAHLLLYKSPNFDDIQPNEVFPVTIRVQGFLGRFNLSPFGTWNRSDSNGAPAIQHLSLTCSGLVELWTPVVDAIFNIRKLIHASLGSVEREDEHPENAHDIYMQRRVFTKITPQNAHLQDVLTSGEDPSHLRDRVAANWRVTEKIQLGRCFNGEFVACPFTSFSTGDFVDVGASFDISVRRSGGRQRVVRAHLRIEHVLLLASAKEVRHVGMVFLCMLQSRSRSRYKILHPTSVRYSLLSLSAFSVSYVGSEQTKSCCYCSIIYFEREKTAVRRIFNGSTLSDHDSSPGEDLQTKTTSPPKSAVALDPDRTFHFGPENIIRFEKFANYADPASLTFSVDNIPADGAWGIKKAFSNQLSFLCDPERNEPYTLWICGLLSAVFFYDEGQPRNYPKPFTAVYDARETFKNKGLMDTYPVQDLKVRDAVLVEVALRRHTPKSDEDRSDIRSKTWDHWKTKFELKAISLIHNAVESSEVTECSTESNISI
ncbi:hypothetical protein BJ138DRAFT_1208189, partial [Hygrophoropsis aurantiaca]